MLPRIANTEGRSGSMDNVTTLNTSVKISCSCHTAATENARGQRTLVMVNGTGTGAIVTRNIAWRLEKTNFRMQNAIIPKTGARKFSVSSSSTRCAMSLENTVVLSDGFGVMMVSVEVTGMIANTRISSGLSTNATSQRTIAAVVEEAIATMRAAFN